MSVGENPYSDDPNAYRDDTNPYAAPDLAADAVRPGPDDSHLAGRGSRFGARFLDGIINLVITLPIMFATDYFARVASNQVSLFEMAVWSASGLVLFLVVNGYLLATRGQTVGKVAAGIRIVDQDTRQILSLPKVLLVRELPPALVGMIPVIGGFIALIDIAFIFRQDRRCVHDMLANTIVEKVA